MADVNFRVHLGKVAIGIEWQVYKAPINCCSIELTGDVQWQWCSDKDSGAVRTVGVLQRESILDTELFVKKDESIIWIKASTPGFIYEKCVR